MIKRITMKHFLYFFVFFLLLTLGLFYLLNVISSQTLQKNLIRSSMNQMDYADSMLNSVISGASLYGIQYTVDDRVRLYYREKQSLDNYDAQAKKNEIYDLLSNALLSNQSIDSISIYWKKDDDFISTSHDVSLAAIFKGITSRGWKVVNGDLFYFSFFPLMKPQFQPFDIQYVVGIKIKTSVLSDLLSKAVNSNSSRAFFLINKSFLFNGKPVDNAIVEKAKVTIFPNNENIMKFDYRIKEGDYYVLSKYSSRIDTYLVTYTRVSDFLVPLNHTRQVFFLSIAAIFLIGLIIILIFYRNFYRSIHLLNKKFLRVEQGHYNTRIAIEANREFNQLFGGFNHMVAQIQSLFASLKLETALRKTAEFKQLQSQINPHFLYNSLFYIISVARTSPESVERMSKHLAEYYRYLTKLGSHEVTFGSELKLAEHYLIIISLCKDLEYAIQLPSELESLPLIPLIVQPMLENAVQHGIESRIGAHRISIVVEQRADELQIRISDDGKGMNSRDIRLLQTRLEDNQAPEGPRGTGLWNINQRLRNVYGKASGLSFSRNDWGGLTITAHLHLNQSEGGNYAIIDR